MILGGLTDAMILLEGDWRQVGLLPGSVDSCILM